MKLNVQYESTDIIKSGLIYKKMIGETLQLVADELNAYFKLKFDTSEDKVSLDSVVSPEGTIESDNFNKVLVSLVNIHQEKLTRNYGSYKSQGINQFSKSKPAVTLHIYFAVSCLFNEHTYTQALTFLSAVIQFFQNKYAFTRDNTPQLDKNIGKIIFEIENYSSQDISHIWGIIGAKYVPSVIYKMSVINYTSDDVNSIIPAASSSNTDNNPVSR